MVNVETGFVIGQTNVSFSTKMEKRIFYAMTTSEHWVYVMQPAFGETTFQLPAKYVMYVAA